MNYTNLSRININLLLVFNALMTEGSVTRASRRLHLTQGAVSHALARLREHLDDQLFVPSRHGMKPTARAISLADPIQEALKALDTALEPLTFDPASSQHQFRIASTDYFSTLVLPYVVTRLEAEAPNVRIRNVPHVISNVSDMFQKEEIDFAIGFFSNSLRHMLPPYSESTTLMEDRLVCVMRRGHPLASRRIPAADYLDATHLKYSSGADSASIIDEYLDRHNLERRIGLSIGHYLAAPLILKNTTMVMTTPSRIARLFCEYYDLDWSPLPYDLPTAPTQIVWSSRMERHPAHLWLRTLIIDTAHAHAATHRLENLKTTPR